VKDGSDALPSAFAHLLSAPCATLTAPLAPKRSAPENDDAQLSASDAAHLARALELATLGIGRTHPNPPVGAVIVDDDGRVLGEGYHAVAGGAHAEVAALDDARARGHANVRGSTLFVSLEPCAHHGRTPPCADRLVDEGVRKVVIGARDPNARVDGKGIERLRQSGAEVVLVEGALSREARALIAPFTTTMLHGRPYVLVKVATSLDGRVATATGHARWITGEVARARVHALRASVDAILVGSGTARADDPELTARGVRDPLDRVLRQPRRILVDGALATPTSAKLFARRDDDRAPPLVLHVRGADPNKAAALDAVGVERVDFPVARAAAPAGTRVPLVSALSALTARGLTSVLVEPGPGLFTALLVAGLVDEIWWMRAPRVLGGDGVPVVSALALHAVDDGPRFVRAHAPLVLGDDELSVLRPL